MKNKGAKAKAKPAKKAQPSQQALKVAKQVIPKGTAATVGGLLGALLGPKGALLGAAAGKAIGRITGVGDYTVSNNTIHTMGGSTLSGEVPSFGRQNDSTRVRHREFIADVVVPSTPTLFNNTSYVINPSNLALFPWLAKFAENYQQYELRGMVIVFKTTTSDYAASGSLGKIALSTNYNVRDSDFVNMQEVENSQFAVSGKPSLSHIHPIECAANNGVPLRKWVRDLQYDASGGDDRLYDVGKFQIATIGLPMVAGTVIGELWVSYDFEFFKPVVGRSSSESYVPVVVPVFDTLNGLGAPSRVMSETSYGVADTSSRAAFETSMLSPAKFARADSTTNYNSAQISRSSFRTVPDPSSDPDGSFPSFWTDPSTLILQRKGTYNISLKFEVNPQYATIPRTTTSSGWNFNAANLGGSPAGMFKEWLMRANIYSVDSAADYKYQVFHQQMSGTLSPATKASEVTSYDLFGSENLFYANSPHQYNIVVFLKEDLIGGVGVKFHADRNGGVGRLSWDGSDLWPLAPGYGFTMNVTYSNSILRTFYQPVETGLLKSDVSLINKSMESLNALLPKLRDLGLVQNS